MSNLNITSANAIYTITIAGLFDAPQRLQNFAADNAFDTQPLETAQVQMGVDGFMSSGYVPNPTRQSIHFSASSDSAFIFEDWLQAQKATRSIYQASAIIILPALGRKYTLNNGVLTSFIAIPSARRVLEARVAELTWGDVAGANV